MYTPAIQRIPTYRNGKNNTIKQPMVMSITTAAKIPLPTPKAQMHNNMPNSIIPDAIHLVRTGFWAKNSPIFPLSFHVTRLDVCIQTRKAPKNKRQTVLIIKEIVICQRKRGVQKVCHSDEGRI